MTASRYSPADLTADGLRSFRTLRDLLRFAVSRFEQAGLSYGHGTDNSFDEAVWLVLWSLHLPLDRLDVFLDATVAPGEADAVLALIDQRCRDRVPLAYLTGEAWLCGQRFLSDARALVPRSLIAEALAGGLDDWLAESPGSVLDLCTGGGSLAILAAQRWPQAAVSATDLSTDALALAGENLRLHGLSERITLLQGDLYAGLDAATYDLILCNPPYVNQASIEALPPEFRAEPAGALAGGDDGMDLIRRILAQAPRHLNPGGAMLLEIGHEAGFFEAAFPDLEFGYLPVAAGESQLVWITAEALANASDTSAA